MPSLNLDPWISKKIEPFTKLHGIMENEFSVKTKEKLQSLKEILYTSRPTLF